MDDLTATVRGLTIGCGSDYPFAPEFPAGWFDTPQIRTDDTPRSRRDGVIPGDDFYAGRPGAFVVRLTGSPMFVESRISTLAQTFAAGPTEERLDLRFFGDPAEYAFFGRCRGIQVGWRTRAQATVSADVRCSFMATDPARYGSEAVQVIGLDTDVLPNDLPFILGYHDSETIAQIGTSPIDRWTVEMEAIGGDLVTPSIAHVGEGQIIFADLTIDEGDTLLIDGQERRALLNGVTPIVPTIAQWWTLAPGDNTIRFAAAVASSLSSTATLTYRPGYA